MRILVKYSCVVVQRPLNRKTDIKKCTLAARTLCLAFWCAKSGAKFKQRWKAANSSSAECQVSTNLLLSFQARYCVISNPSVSKMAHVCTICKKDNRKGPKLAYFLFPKRDDLRGNWLAACGQEQAKLSADARVCELHFDEKDLNRFPKK